MNFIAELGDKTQLVTLMFAARFPPLVVLAGIAAGTAASQAVSAALGGLVGTLLPGQWVKLLAGLAFVSFGFWTLQDEDDENEEEVQRKRVSPLWLVASTFFLAEMGDKTMLGNMALSASYSPVLVFLGGTTGMVLSDGLAILVGKTLGDRLPKRAVKVGAAALFLGFGALSLVQGLLGMHPAAWVAVALLAAGIGFVLRKRPRPTAQQSEAAAIRSDGHGKDRM